MERIYLLQRDSNICLLTPLLFLQPHPPPKGVWHWCLTNVHQAPANSSSAGPGLQDSRVALSRCGL
jgi:hypothetical protein